MKNLLILLFLIIVFSSCKKNYETIADVILIDETTKEPIENGTVYLLKMEGSSWTVPGGYVTSWECKKTNASGKCSFMFNPDSWGYYKLAAEAVGYYEEDDFNDDIYAGDSKEITLELHPEAYVKVYIKNISPYDSNDVIKVYGVASPNSWGGEYFYQGVDVDTFTFSTTYGNAHRSSFYSVRKNNIETEYSYEFYCPAHDTTYYYINY